jgi:hypothetical protein
MITPTDGSCFVDFDFVLVLDLSIAKKHLNTVRKQFSWMLPSSPKSFDLGHLRAARLTANLDGALVYHVYQGQVKIW